MRAMLLAGLIVGSAATGNAQKAHLLLIEGDRVRVTHLASQLFRKEGTVVERRGDSLAVKFPFRADFASTLSYSVVNLKFREIDSLSIATSVRGARIWVPRAAIGVALGFLVTAGCKDPVRDPTPSEIDFELRLSPRCKEWRTIMPILGGLTGFIFGRGTRWTPIATRP